jgi:hypothetical protein
LKKFIIILMITLFIVILTSSCGNLSGVENSRMISTVSSQLNEEISEEYILGLLDMTNTEIKGKLGKYEEGIMAMEESHMIFPVLSFTNGLTFYFSNGEDTKPLKVECSENVTFKNIKGGMDFSQVQEHLGGTEIIETWIGNEEVIAYKIQYGVGKLLIEFISYERNGEASSMLISKVN